MLQKRTVPQKKGTMEKNHMNQKLFEVDVSEFQNRNFIRSSITTNDFGPLSKLKGEELEQGKDCFSHGMIA